MEPITHEWLNQMGFPPWNSSCLIHERKHTRRFRVTIWEIGDGDWQMEIDGKPIPTIHDRGQFISRLAMLGVDDE